MNERPTPETDALEHKQLNEGCPQWNDMMRWVRENAALARKIERERNAWRAMATELADAAAYGLAQWNEGYPLEVCRKITDLLTRFKKMQEEVTK